MSVYGFSGTVANATLGILNGTVPTTYATVYIQLHVGNPGTAGTTSISAGSTTRPSATFGTASGGVVSITGTPSWTNGGTSETLTAVSWWSAATSGTYLGSGLLTTSQAWASANVFTLASLSVTIPTAS